MNNAGGIRGEGEEKEEEGEGCERGPPTQHASLAVLCSLYTPCGGAGGEVAASCKGLEEGGRLASCSLSPFSELLCLLAACLLGCLAAATLSDLITLYKSKGFCQAHSLH